MNEKFFSGERGAARSPGDVCYRCSLPASEHRRDMVNGRDRLLCPSPDTWRITRLEPTRGQIAGQPPDRLTIAGAVARNLVGNLGPTLDQKTQQSDEAVYFLNTDGVNKFNPSTRQIEFMGGRRLGKSNAIANRMRANTRDEKLRDRALEQADRKASGEPPIDFEKLEQFLKQAQDDRRRSNDERLQENARLQEQELYGLMARITVPTWRVTTITSTLPEQAKQPKPQPTITIGAKRAYFED